MGPSQRGGRWGLLLPLLPLLLPLLLLRRRRRLRARQPAPACSFGLAIYGRTTIPASVTTKSHSSLHSHADGHNNGSKMWMLDMRHKKSVAGGWEDKRDKQKPDQHFAMGIYLVVPFPPLVSENSYIHPCWGKV